MESISNLEMLMWLRGKINEYEIEIKYLEELLVTTSGPADDVVNDLEANRMRKRTYEQEYARYMKLIEDERNAEQKSQ